MDRRAASHDYTRPGLYHITLHVAECLGQPLGAVVGSLSVADGSADAPHTALTRVGQMVEHELLTAIHQHYPMVAIQDYVIMPEHLHFLMVVSDHIVSKNGTVRIVGDIISGYKKGCNKRYWEMTGNSDGQTAAHTVPCGFPAGYKVPSWGTTDRQPLFAPGYCDVMPVDAAQLATQRAYIAGNPRSRLLRMSNRALLTVQHGAITTALTPVALGGTRIAPKEREIMDEAVNHGFPVITFHDNGFADRYHPSADRLDLCAEDRLLIVSPWKYQYRGKNEQVTVLFCKAMNCVAQALCRTRDNWWKSSEMLRTRGLKAS
jgi:hypothetical protein